ncbi:feruloyl esterase [Altererythrobacter atlanticus]|uniref:Tannase and feruloyl esterase n=1 Tax=Croceibacterium atlanticum TaxID=1267766 RepID=A0A0F7KN45_9SPHN|nr:tannase/feruloyl esterase family alpha/beta hydrolase [Croceibacterium atlanticum]AKH41953.1 Tannase and feruloyl esterase [Croceibacterium atlanticum]MBB5733479.1 feruloyl esterase [Croceibacterium atlanticum]
MTFDKRRDLGLANERMPELRADSTDIAAFMEAGHKAIIYQGWQDPSTNAGPAIDYLARLSREHGKISDSVRMFMVPGMYHCGGGPGVDVFGGSNQKPIAPGADPSRDMLWALIDWVEKGRAPGSIVGAKVVPGQRGFTRRLCPFPQVARYDGIGPETDARSYDCAISPALERLLD